MQIEGLVTPSQEWGAQHEGVESLPALWCCHMLQFAWCLQLFRNTGWQGLKLHQACT